MDASQDLIQQQSMVGVVGVGLHCMNTVNVEDDEVHVLSHSISAERQTRQNSDISLTDKVSLDLLSLLIAFNIYT